MAALVAHSFAVTQQYSGAVGKLTSCQTLVTLTLVRGELPITMTMRFFLPVCWADELRRRPRRNPTRRARASGAIARHRGAGPRGAAAGVFGLVLADAPYGTYAAFRRALSARRLTWAVGCAPRCNSISPPFASRGRVRVGGRGQNPKPLTKPGSCR